MRPFGRKPKGAVRIIPDRALTFYFIKRFAALQIGQHDLASFDRFGSVYQPLVTAAAEP